MQSRSWPPQGLAPLDLCYLRFLVERSLRHAFCVVSMDSCIGSVASLYSLRTLDIFGNLTRLP